MKTFGADICPSEMPPDLAGDRLAYHTVGRALLLPPIWRQPVQLHPEHCDGIRPHLPDECIRKMPALSDMTKGSRFVRLPTLRRGNRPVGHHGGCLYPHARSAARIVVQRMGGLAQRAEAAARRTSPDIERRSPRQRPPL